MPPSLCHHFSISQIITINILGKKIFSWPFHSPYYSHPLCFLFWGNVFATYSALLLFCLDLASDQLHRTCSYQWLVVTSVASVISQFWSFLMCSCAHMYMHARLIISLVLSGIIGSQNMCIKFFLFWPWLVWLSALTAGLRTKGSLVRFLLRVHAWVAGQVPK